MIVLLRLRFAPLLPLERETTIFEHLWGNDNPSLALILLQHEIILVKSFHHCTQINGCGDLRKVGSNVDLNQHPHYERRKET